MIRSLKELSGRSAKDFLPRDEPNAVLMCAPDHFDVIDVKNPHMEGQIGRVDRKKAAAQWNGVKTAFEKCGAPVYLIPPTEGLEDMVFTANPVLPGKDPSGERVCVLSNMRHPSRKEEVPAYESWFSKRGYQIERLFNSHWNFEGQGDALWHPGRKLLWGGYGYRTVPEAYEEIGRIFSTPVVLLKLVDERFYHLDTCLCVISENEALYYPPAFEKEGVELIRALFKNAIEVPEEEALKGFACNAHALGKTVLIQSDNPKTSAELQKRGYKVVELDTSEFIKSGGSVFCMKMMVYA